jgi:hypothetical protein
MLTSALMHSTPSFNHVRYDLVSGFEPIALLPRIPLLLSGRRDLRRPR